MGMYVVLTAHLFQNGSSESKPIATLARPGLEGIARPHRLGELVRSIQQQEFLRWNPIAASRMLIDLIKQTLTGEISPETLGWGSLRRLGRCANRSPTGCWWGRFGWGPA